MDHYSGTLKMRPGIVVDSYWRWSAGLHSFLLWRYIGSHVRMRTDAGPWWKWTFANMLPRSLEKT